MNSILLDVGGKSLKIDEIQGKIQLDPSVLM